MAGTTSKSAEQDIKALSDQIDTLRGDLAQLTDLVGEIGVRRRNEAYEKVGERIEALRGQAGEAREALQDHARAAERQAVETVRDQPGLAMAAAAGLGFLAGFVTGRR